MNKQNLFPASEYERRQKNVRAEALRRGIEALIVTVPDDICYLTGYQTFGEATQYLILPPDGAPTFVLRELESHLVSLTTYVASVRTYGESERGVDAVANALRDLDASKATVGVDLGHVSSTDESQLREACSDCRIIDSSGVVGVSRVRKSDLELAACREASRMTVVGMEAAYSAAREGVTENDISAAAFKAMTVAGAEWLTQDPIITSGERSGIPHTTYARRVVQPGDTILLEFSGCYYRYNGPLMRTCVVGPPSPTVRSMYAACEEALEAAMAAVRPGVTSGEAHAACQQVIDRAGFTDNFRKRLGYAIGLGFNSWSEGSIFDLKADDPRVLEEAMVFHMPPALRIIGQLGVGVSETIVVTSSGCEALADLSRELVVV
jgi:Xaa-Pro dipeptidase